MALTPNSLTVLSIGATRPNGQAGARRKLHLYTSDDTHATVSGAGYFSALYQRLNPGDIILAALDLGGTPQLRAYIVTASSASSVSIAQITTV
ncbi:hypothetical protein [Caldovatus aquaticus]|uniref:Uncharacterized protein n=1 Tax=Caldovatus aquaticus TaxID=2865671 RepID=A0ABS7EYY0_9PROT|nr:hypothetical protein [Caldovatus aquaticus]MBW8268288.1 hypothetical protein [Caldovatus aquaticus]